MCTDTLQYAPGATRSKIMTSSCCSVDWHFEMLQHQRRSGFSRTSRTKLARCPAIATLPCTSEFIEQHVGRRGNAEYRQVARV